MGVSHYMPHGHCYLWEPGLVGLHVTSDLLIGLAYVSISISLYLLIRKIRMPFSFIVLAFGVFIGACGMTHFLEVWNLWEANYWLGGWIKALTALASVYTCLALIRLSPKILSFAEAAKISGERGVKLEAAYLEMENRVRERTQELELAHHRERAAKEQMEGLYLAAQKANRLKDEFLATMSHELRTPLSVILGYSELLVNNELEGPEKSQALATIRRNAQTQSQLVNDLLDVSMIMSGKMQLSSKIVDLKEPIEDAMESVGLAAKAKDILISLDFSGNDFFVFGDVTRLQQIIWNLLSNAIKFTPKNGKVWVTLSRLESRCVVAIRDSGQGIDPQFLSHVFERFSQEDSSSSRKFGGLGLGLGIVRHLTELHGGSIDVSSDGKGKGAQFTLSLPVAPVSSYTSASEAQLALQKSLKEKIKGLRILVIDDEPDVRRLLETFLHRQGIDVEAAGNATEALSKYTSFHPQVMICDIGMPDIDGYRLIRMIRDQELKSGGFVPAIALTAYAQEGIRQKALASGFQSYLMKPAPSEDLLREIGQLIQV